MRRRQGVFFVYSGAAHVLLMGFACLYSLGLFPRLSIRTYQWNMAYFDFFMWLYVGSAALIIGESLRSDVFVPQAVLDALVGAAAFQALFWTVRHLLARWPAFPWIALIPGIFLVYYGLKLRRGSALWRRLELD